jgi:uncharacterized protein YbbK (DUF523 family)
MVSRRNKARPSYKLLVSACLAGIDCTYKGRNNLRKNIKRLVDAGRALPICPEVLGGSAIPRPQCEILGGDGASVLDGSAKVVTRSGRDVTRLLVTGARKTLRLAKKYAIKKAILKANSPSCGCGRIYDGTFTRRLIKGSGVTAALLGRNGIKMRTEKG